MEESPRSRKPKNSFVKNVKIYLRKYCSCSSVHGFQYFGEEERSIFERIWWFIIIFTCLAFCVTAIYATYAKWEQSPVIVNFANKATPIYEIPFPAVTICPESKSRQDKFNYTRIMQMKKDGTALNSTEETYFDYMSLVCKHIPNLTYANNKTFSDDFYDVLFGVTPEFQIENCIYMNVELGSCAKYYSPVLTNEGICYTYNMLERSEIFREKVIHYNTSLGIGMEPSKWSLDGGYFENSGVDSYPGRAFLAGVANGFSFTLVTKNRDLDFACRDALQGYRVLLHAPSTIPSPDQKFFRIPLDQSIIGAIQPEMITTSSAIKSYHPSRRRCYFPSERYLRYFKIYTSTSCKLECLTNFTLEVCECVHFFMPRENGTRICGTGNIKCMQESAQFLEMMDLFGKLENFDFPTVDCDCLPICSDLTYEVETSQCDWEWKRLMEAKGNNEKLDEVHMSSVTLFFKSDHFISSERNELCGPLDFLANIGGLLGLFTGFSILSAIEIIYFLTLRIIFNKRLYGRWAGVTK